MRKLSRDGLAAGKLPAPSIFLSWGWLPGPSVKVKMLKIRGSALLGISFSFSSPWVSVMMVFLISEQAASKVFFGPPSAGEPAPPPCFHGVRDHWGCVSLTTRHEGAAEARDGRRQTGWDRPRRDKGRLRGWSQGGGWVCLVA